MIIEAKSLSDMQRKLGALEIKSWPVLIDVSQGDLRTINSNKRYWACIVSGIQRYMRAQDMSYTKEAVHEFLKQERFGKKVVQVGERVQEVSARSSRMSRKQFADFAAWAEAFAIDDLGIPVDYFLDSGDVE